MYANILIHVDYIYCQSYNVRKVLLHFRIYKHPDKYLSSDLIHIGDHSLHVDVRQLQQLHIQKWTLSKNLVDNWIHTMIHVYY